MCLPNTDLKVLGAGSDARFFCGNQCLKRTGRLHYLGDKPSQNITRATGQGNQNVTDYYSVYEGTTDHKPALHVSALVWNISAFSICNKF